MQGKAPVALESVVVKQLAMAYDDLTSSFNLSLFCCLICALIGFKLLTRTRRSSTCKLPPSPPKLPIIGNLHQLGTLPHRSFGALSRKYGPLMFLQLGQTPALVVSSAHVAREIVKTNDVSFSGRPPTTAPKILLYGCKDVAFAPHGDEWRQKRKICVVELLSRKRVRSFRFIREEEVSDLLHKIREACFTENNNGSICPVNLTQMLVAASNNIVSRSALGQKYETLDGKTSSEEIGRKVMRQLYEFSIGNFFPCLRWMDVVTGVIPRLKASFRELDAFFDQVIAQHKTVVESRKNGVKNFLDILLQLQHDEMLDFELTHDSIKAMLVDMYVGGSDTTSTTLEWGMAELVRNPEKMKKAQEEVRGIVGDKSKVEEDDVNEMRYLKCVVKETLRLHPPGPLLVPRETTCSAKLRGYDIPPGTTVFVNAWAIQRDPEFWERAEEFIPERFENSEVDFKGKDFQFIPFGIGRRGCPGISFGVASVEYILANLLYWFDWKMPTTGTAEHMDMSEAYGLTVSKKVPLHLQPLPHSFC